MGKSNTPLRYPGGKSVLSNFLAKLIEVNGLLDGTYIEPFCGGAGAAINLLYSEHVEKIILNDADRSIYLFWKSILRNTDNFVRLIYDTPVTIDEWRKQKYIFFHRSSFSSLQVGFATFFLNRCNRSGILYSGPIGGQNQSGEWKLGARFNKIDLIERIEKIALYKSRISIHNNDAIEFLTQKVSRLAKSYPKILVYLDPPYYRRGSPLYLNFYKKEDHSRLAEFIKGQLGYKWIISYNNSQEILKLYKDQVRTTFRINYFAHSHSVGQEIMIYSDGCVVPKNRPQIKDNRLSSGAKPGIRPSSGGKKASPFRQSKVI